jgi:predicted glycosyltransferase involved in capsule biosynthesis
MLVDVPWNQDACRNLGVAHATTDWILLIDMDQMVPAETMRQLMTADFRPDWAYKFSRLSAPSLKHRGHHPNCWFMTRLLYESIGGYDERFAGYYGTDGDFNARVMKAAEIVVLDSVLVRAPVLIPDSRTQTL